MWAKVKGRRVDTGLHYSLNLTVYFSSAQIDGELPASALQVPDLDL